MCTVQSGATGGGCLQADGVSVRMSSQQTRAPSGGFAHLWMQKGAGGAAGWMFLGKFTDEGMDIAPRIRGSQGVERTRGWWLCPIAARKRRHQLSNVSLSVAAGAERTSGSNGSDGAAGPYGK